MNRRLFNLLAAVSLALFSIVVALWVRSHGPLDSLGHAGSVSITRTEPLYWFISSPGRLTLCRQVGKDWSKPLRGHYLGGISFGGLWGNGSILWNLVVPYWMLALLTFVLPAIAAQSLWRAHARKRNRAGICKSCGYDLRATPDRCPECGATTKADN